MSLGGGGWTVSSFGPGKSPTCPQVRAHKATSSCSPQKSLCDTSTAEAPAEQRHNPVTSRPSILRGCLGSPQASAALIRRACPQGLRTRGSIPCPPRGRYCSCLPHCLPSCPEVLAWVPSCTAQAHWTRTGWDAREPSPESPPDGSAPQGSRRCLGTAVHLQPVTTMS